ncbi:unnamed protein product [Oreochromis niloticus]|nr:unnamed protein product [Mustela putorius furo]
MEIQNEAELCFPELLNSSCRRTTLHWSKAVLLYIVLFCISLITAALNLLVIISVSHFRQLHTPTNILLLALAVSDFLVGLLLMPLEIVRGMTCWVLGDLMCSVYIFLTGNVTCASIGNIVLISVDRYVAICYPLHYPTRITVARVKLSVCVGFMPFSTSVFMQKTLIEPGRYSSCYGECVLVVSVVVGIVDLVLSYFVPVTVIIVLYMRVFVVAVSQARAMRSHVTTVALQRSLNQTNKSELKAARTLGILVVVFLLCSCPYYCISFARDNYSSVPSIVFDLFFLNSSLNPLIYAMFYPWFRKTVTLIVTLQILQTISCEVSIL